MLRLLSKRFYCKIATKANEKANKLDFKQLTHPTKVPQTPVDTEFPDTSSSEIEIDTKTIQLLAQAE